jgi:hypothetical protein
MKARRDCHEDGKARRNTKESGVGKFEPRRHNDRERHRGSRMILLRRREDGKEHKVKERNIEQGISNDEGESRFCMFSRNIMSVAND